MQTTSSGEVRLRSVRSPSSVRETTGIIITRKCVLSLNSRLMINDFSLLEINWSSRHTFCLILPFYFFIFLNSLNAPCWVRLWWANFTGLPEAETPQARKSSCSENMRCVSLQKELLAILSHLEILVSAHLRVFFVRVFFFVYFFRVFFPSSSSSVISNLILFLIDY